MELLLVLFTAIVAFATIGYVIYTSKLWKTTEKNIKATADSLEQTKKLFGFNLLSSFKDNPRYSVYISKIIGKVYSKEIEDIIEELKESPKNVIGQKDVIDKLIEDLENHEIKAHAEAGNLKAAIEMAEGLYQKDHSRVKDYADVLLLSSDDQDWNKAWTILKENGTQIITHYISLSYKFWDNGKVIDAIEVGEKGIRNCKRYPKLFRREDSTKKQSRILLC